MRNDMSKVLVERARLGSRGKFSWRRHAYERKCRSRHEDEDALALTMPMGFRGSKGLNENLKPLQRFLMRRRGRVWNAVYAEIRRQLSPKSTIDMHIMQHLWWYVLREHLLNDGSAVLIDQYGAVRGSVSSAQRALGSVAARGTFYICAKTGRLLFARGERKQKRCAEEPQR